MGSIYHADEWRIPSAAYFAASAWFWDQNWPWDAIIYRENYEIITFPKAVPAAAEPSPTAIAWVS
jgi:hypothetical protein